MPTSFQPEKPYADSKGTGAARSTPIVTALISAVLVIMLFALGLPRFSDGDTNWLVTFGAGAVVFLLVLVLGQIKGRRAS
jgi:hypothetical protein